MVRVVIGEGAPFLMLGLLAVLPVNLDAQSRDWDPSERAVIGDFTNIVAVAVSEQEVFAVTPSAVVIYRPDRREWQGPYSPPAPQYLAGAVAALADPLDQTLWVIRRDGWIRFDPRLRTWEQGSVAGTVLDAAVDQDNPAAGLYLRISSGWVVAARGSPVAFPAGPPARPLRPASVQDALRTNPALQANSAALLLTSRLRSARFTSAAPASGFTGRGWYLGTAGAGLLYVPEGSPNADRLTYGLPGSSVAAVFVAPAGGWVITEREARAEPSLSFVGADLSTFEWVQGSWIRGLPFFQARRLAGFGSALWLATDAGLIRVEPRTEDIISYDQGRGLPDNRVLDVAVRRGVVVAGTMHGVVAVDSAGLRRLAPDFADEARAVLPGPDTLWVGTRRGLFYVTGEDNDLSRPAALESGLALQGAVLDLVWRADTLVALLQDRLLIRRPGGEYTLGPLFGSSLGRVHTLYNTRDALFVAGEQGVARTGLDRPLGRPLLVPVDLPGTVTDLAVDDRWLWVATLEGLVRFNLDVVPR